MKKKFAQIGRGKLKSLTMVLLIVATGAVAFILGAVSSNTWQQAPIVVERGEVSIVQSNTNNDNSNNKLKESAKKCALVGSRNGTKYYPPTCSHARRISPKNLRCFATEDDAKNAGYTRSTSCK